MMTSDVWGHGLLDGMEHFSRITERRGSIVGGTPFKSPNLKYFTSVVKINLHMFCIKKYEEDMQDNMMKLSCA